MINLFTVGGLVFGQGAPKICACVTGASVDELQREIDASLRDGADFIEWRADAFPLLQDMRAMAAACAQIKSACGAAPLLLTVRSKAEGGAVQLSPEAYARLTGALIDCCAADIFDIEHFTAAEESAALVQQAHDKGRAVIASSHNFAFTPDFDTMGASLLAMQKSGADIVKLAVMPSARTDVLELMGASECFARLSLCPVISISMGEVGMLSRLAGAVSASCASFASVGPPAAPGQMSVAQLRQIYDVLYRC